MSSRDIEREGPLPKVDDDSELVGENDKRGLPDDGSGPHDHERVTRPVTLPAHGAGAYPAPVFTEGTAGATDEGAADDEEDGESSS